MADLGCVRLGNDEDVEECGQIQTPRAEYLPDQPLDPIAHHGVTHPGADGDAEPACPSRRRSLDDHEAPTVPPLPLSLQLQELPTPPQPDRIRKGSGARHGNQPGCFGGMETVSRLRPLARRRFNTARPVGVAMRARNPWVRIRRRLLGW